MSAGAGEVRVRRSGVQLPSGWPQAGFPSFAYRLAHLRLPSPPLVLALGVIFFLI
jgi:hypothetical protein